MKRFCTVLLAVVMMLGTLAYLPLSVSANGPYGGYEKYWEGDFCYIIDNEEAIIVSGPNTAEVIVPATLGGYPVTTIGFQSFNNQGLLKSVTLPGSITLIDGEAFSDCINLGSINLPNGLTTISYWAFSCTDLKTDIVIPSSVMNIGNSAFKGCWLTSIKIPASVISMGEEVFDRCTYLTDIYCEVEAKPEGWDDAWLGDCTATVHWGYKPEPEGPETPEVALGDLGGNGKIDATDYMLLKRFCLGTKELTEEQKAVADVNRDGKINAADYMLLKRHVLGTYTIV